MGINSTQQGGAQQGPSQAPPWMGSAPLTGGAVGMGPAPGAPTAQPGAPLPIQNMGLPQARPGVPQQPVAAPVMGQPSTPQTLMQPRQPMNYDPRAFALARALNGNRF